MNGGGVFQYRMKTGTGEAVAQELSLGTDKLTFAQTNCKAVVTAQL